MSKKDKDERARKKRADYLEAALIMDRLIDNRYFPNLVEALKKGDKGEGAFKKLCKDIEIPEGMVDTLWKTLLDVDSRMDQDPGWLF